MAQTNEVEFYGKAFLAQGNGDLVTVTNYSVKMSNGAKQKHTLRRPGAGMTKGLRENEITFDFLIGENGFERDFVRDMDEGKVKQLRSKLPGGATLVYNGCYSDLQLDAPLDDAVKGTITFKGKMEDQRQSLVNLAA